MTCSAPPDPYADEPDPAAAVCLSELRGTGKFGELAPLISLQGVIVGVTATGVLAYDWQDVAGESHQKESPFSQWLPIGTLVHQVECGEGGYPSEFDGNTFKFDVEKQNYRIPMRLDATVAAGKTGRWRMFLDAPKSSEHQFHIVLQLSDGRRIASRPIDFLYFKPSR